MRALGAAYPDPAGALETPSFKVFAFTGVQLSALASIAPPAGRLPPRQKADFVADFSRGHGRWRAG
jgi:hypothetical protein